MKSTIVELCCGTVDEVRLASEAGVHRIELCAGLACGGLTPSPAMVDFALATGMETMAMVRSREGGFVYSEDEFECMVADAKRLVRQGASGLVFGFLTPDGELDTERMKRLVGIAGGKPVMLHRAFDATANLGSTLENLIEIGVNRVLTSGRSESAIQGATVLHQMVSMYGENIQIVAGGGIRPESVTALLEQTQVPAIHFAARQNIDGPGYAGIPEPTPDASMLQDVIHLVKDYDKSRA